VEEIAVSDSNDECREKETVEEAGAKGGKARAEKLTPEQRREIARRAADARWHGDVPTATHAGVLNLAGRQIVCAVLEDGRRVLNQETFLTVIGRAPKAKAGTGSTRLGQVDVLPPFLAADNLKPFIGEDLRRSTSPVVYRTQAGGRAFGYEATLLPGVCQVYLEADRAGATKPTQRHIVEACRLLSEALANVAIIALVDEATGYQYERPRLELQEYLALYINKKLARWVSTFPPEFYRELYRLRKWKYNESSTARTAMVGKLTNDLIYSRLAPFVLEELKRITPKNDKGRRTHKFHQRLTPDPGIKELKDHFRELLAIMRGYDDYDPFLRHVNRALPVQPQQPDLFSGLPDPFQGVG
jgi:hypothetical protein